MRDLPRRWQVGAADTLIMCERQRPSRAPSAICSTSSPNEVSAPGGKRVSRPAAPIASSERPPIGCGSTGATGSAVVSRSAPTACRCCSRRTTDGKSVMMLGSSSGVANSSKLLTAARCSPGCPSSASWWRRSSAKRITCRWFSELAAPRTKASALAAAAAGRAEWIREVFGLPAAVPAGAGTLAKMTAAVCWQMTHWYWPPLVACSEHANTEQE